jgi:hypothetical protein
MNRIVEVLLQYPITTIFLIIIIISTVSMITESIKKRKNRK